MGRQLGKQFLARVAVLVVMFAALLGFVLVHTIWEVNRVEADNVQKAVATLVQNQIDQVALMADDNGLWDDAVEAVYAGTDPSFAWDAWGTTTAENKYYSFAGVVDPDARTRFVYRRGKLVTMDVAAELGASYGVLAQRVAAEKQGVAGLVTINGQVAIAGMANISPISRRLNRLVPAAGASKIVFVRPLTPDMVATLGKGITLDDLRFAAPGLTPGTQAIRDVTGKAIGHLVWTPNRPGDAALSRPLPVILIGFFVHIVMVVLLVVRGFTALSDLGRQALVDSLSTLPNRRALKRSLEAHMEKGERVALAMMDLDGFKAVNDNFGHPVGDRLICEVSDLLRSYVTDGGMIARLGGDEFALVLTGWDADTRLEQIAGRIIRRFALPFRIDERTLAVGMSIGLTAGSASTVSVGEFMRRADVALYAAKRAGKMRFHWFDERLDLVRDKAGVIAKDLRDALDQGQFSLVYQPQIRVSDMAISSAEALLRWTHPERGEVPPSDFIPVADETGLIDRIGLWVIERACTDGLGWADQMVTINISGAQLRNPNFARQVSETVDAVGFPAARLQFEITEDWLVRDPDAARRVIEDLRALGIAVVLDDFGLGFASAGFLRNFPFTGVKIHRALVAEAETSESARMIVSANVAAARSLGLTICAAGIETDMQADLMRVVGCDEVQGWLFSKTVTADEMTSQIRAGTRKNRRTRRIGAA